MSEPELARQRARRYVSDDAHGFPCRVCLQDVPPGTPVLLVNFEHLPGNSPYRATHAIYVSPADRAFEGIDVVPPSLRSRLLAVRAFDKDAYMVDADVVDGLGLEGLIERFLRRADVAYLHAHYARRGCFAARIDRAT
jgi:hypothetical protein